MLKKLLIITKNQLKKKMFIKSIINVFLHSIYKSLTYRLQKVNSVSVS